MNYPWIPWYQWSQNGLVDFGQMPICEIEHELQKFEPEARKIQQETDSDHVLYGIKLYGKDGELTEVKFYLEPMDDARFERDVASKSNLVAYAVHRR